MGEWKSKLYKERDGEVPTTCFVLALSKVFAAPVDTCIGTRQSNVGVYVYMKSHQRI